MWWLIFHTPGPPEVIPPYKQRLLYNKSLVSLKVSLLCVEDVLFDGQSSLRNKLNTFYRAIPSQNEAEISALGRTFWVRGKHSVSRQAQVTAYPG